jgi:carbonic anhydrase
MKPFRLLIHLLVVVVLVVVSTFTAAYAVDWNHDPKNAIGPNFWGSLSFPFATCGSAFDPVTGVDDGFVEVGKKQTPVDIVVANTTPTALPALTFQYVPFPFVVENTGHVVEVPYPPDPLVAPPSFLRVGQDTYQLLQFHLHAPSEHTVTVGTVTSQFAAELHLVHRNNLLDLAVVGVMIDVGAPVNTVIDQILLNAPERVGEEGFPLGVINATSVLPQFVSYYNYSGSLTTPPCSEGVRWFVLKEPVFVTQGAIDCFRKIIGQFPNYTTDNNNRPVRPLNGRAILNRIGR